WRVLALHAGHGLEDRTRILDTTGVVAIDANPVHLPAVADLVLADDGDVVLGLAGDRASAAADACGEIDAHRPGVRALRRRVVKRAGTSIGGRAADGRRARRGLRDRERANEIASLHVVVGLRRRKRVTTIGAGDRRLFGDPGRVA